MKRFAILAALLSILAVRTDAQPAAERQLVLVSGANVPVAALPPAEVRRLFLGTPSEHAGQQIRALHNDSEPLVREVFLQKIVFMSADHYERHLLAQVYRAGGQRPARYGTLDTLVQALQQQPGAVTYMWASTAREISGITVVQELWRGRVD
jgi:hypothetical protein